MTASRDGANASYTVAGDATVYSVAHERRHAMACRASS